MKPNSINLRGKRFGWVIAGAALLAVIGFGSWAFWPNRGKADVKVVFSHFENVPGGRLAVFQVSNTGTRSVTMYGYGGMWPDYLVGWYHGAKWDLHYSPYREFSGSGPIVLPPGAETAMPTFLPSLESWVVGVQYSTAGYARFLPSWLRRFERVENFVKARMRISWSDPSDPITRTSKPSNVVAPLGAKTNLITVRSKDEFDNRK